MGNGNKNTKAAITLAALNIAGHGNLNVNHQDNKWHHVWQVMREQKIGVLVVREAHLNDERKDSIQNLFGRVIRIEFSQDPLTANAKGVAFVLNKNLVDTEDVNTTEIVPGRAMLLEMKNVDGKPLSILGVYAPNVPAENAVFWKLIQTWFEIHPLVRKPDGMGGDTNVVEDALDRLPAHPDANSAVTALDELKMYLRLVDGWRDTYPTTRAYSYLQLHTGSQSRIDRWYIKRPLLEHALEWEITTVGIKTNHKMVSVKLTTEHAPTVGHGRWVWPLWLVEDKTLAKQIHERGMVLQAEMGLVSNWRTRNPDYNEQTLWAKFKADIHRDAKKRSKKIIPKIITEIIEVENRLRDVLDEKGISEEDRTLSGAVLTERLAKLQQQRYNVSRMNAQVKNRLDGKIISRYWSQINKEKKPREMIHRLRKNMPEGVPPQYEKDSKRMASMARDHHDNLQSERKDIAPEVREEKIRIVVDRVKRKLTPQQIQTLKEKLTIEDVRNALKLSSNFKAPGLDGILYELWKTLDARCTTATAQEKPAFDIIKIMHRVYNDIEKNGIVIGTKFSESWMCPLYKKNDKADIANYRPISLLNTDYKVFTKALTIKL
ncbi:hypothetical protein C8F04DRAFT_966373, partial [Mycena alexandri]